MKKMIFPALVVALLCSFKCSSKVSEPQSCIITMDADDFEEAVSKDALPIIDVRTAEEFASGHLPNAINIDISSPDFSVAELNRDTVAVYCLRGKRSMKAAELLIAQDFTVVNLDGGINAWKEAGKPIE